MIQGCMLRPATRKSLSVFVYLEPRYINPVIILRKMITAAERMGMFITVYSSSLS
jgi:hypothetical protein